MELNLQHEDLLIQLRAKLNEAKIKLWEAPFYDEHNELTDSLKNLAEAYSESIKASVDEITMALKELQGHSLERAKAQSQYNESGLATVRVKTPDRKILSCQLMLKSPARVIVDNVALEIKVLRSRIKLIFNGKVLKNNLTLELQGVKNGSLMMAIVMNESPDKEDELYLEMKSTREDATLLSTVSDQLGEDYLKLEDQWGRPVSVSAESRRSLMVALTLHARGRTSLNEQKYALALLLLLEADQHFAECEDSLLNTVDNYGVLQLDIAWCYLCLQNLTAASDVARRLKVAEDAFKRSYGENMERLISVRGTHANERVLLMRLHLLKGIVCYHQNKRDEAKELFMKAEIEVNALRVDEKSVSYLMEMGWSRMESISALRANAGDVTAAYNMLVTNNENKAAKLEKEKQDRRNRAQYGVCDDGTTVDPKFVAMLMEMGFSMRLSTSALRRSNNIVSQALEFIQDNKISESVTDIEELFSLEQVDEKLTEELTKRGFSEEQAREALRKSRNALSGAIDILNTSSGAGPSGPSTSAKKMKKYSDSEEALRRLTSAIKGDENEHLNTDLQQEEDYLVQYKSLL